LREKDQHLVIVADIEQGIKGRRPPWTFAVYSKV